MAVAVVTPTNLGPEFEIGTNVAGLITVRVDGTSVVRDPVTGSLGAVAPTYDNVATTLTFPGVNGGADTVIDLSALTTDVFVNGASLSGTVLTLTDNDAGTPDVTVDLAAFAGVSTDAGQILVAGSDGKPLLTQATVAAQADCPVTDAFGVAVGNMFA